MTPNILVLGVIWYIIFLFSTTCHEAALGGQVSLNPIPHIMREPLGMVVIPIVTYGLWGWMMGYASAPYDPAWQQRYPRRAAWMALAGPGANFLLVILSALAIRGGMLFGIFREPASVNFTHLTDAAGPGLAGFAATFLSIFLVLNLVLGTFNLFPVPPLDGNVGITLLMSEERALRFMEWTRTQGFGLIGLLVAWYAYDKIFGFIFTLMLNVLYPGSHWG